MNKGHDLQLSIIVPVYNVENYIRPCIESIFRQGLDENKFEVIIVNDGTPDRSMEVIQDIIERHENITVINQENLSLSVARNNGIEKAKGQYILMPDSDDLLIENSLKPLLEKAIESQADLVVADFLRMTSEGIKNLTTIQQKNFAIQEKTGEQLFLEDLNPYECYVWRTLYKREFLNKRNLRFYPGIRFQDVPFTHECYLKAQKCLRASWILNIYRNGHTTAASSTFDIKKAKEFCTAIAKTWELKDLNGLSAKEQNKLHEDVFISFSKMICNIAHEIENSSERKEITDYIIQQVPDLRFNNGVKQRFITFMFGNFPHTYIFLRVLYAKIIEENIRPFIYHRLRRPFLKR